jgi:DNA-directed RNA polymerase specialized sigma24 family protein
VISYEQTDFLLHQYTYLLAMVKNNYLQLHQLRKKYVKDDLTDAIEGMVFAQHQGERVSSGKVSDSTPAIAMHYKEEVWHLFRDSEKLLWEETQIITNLIAKVDNAMLALDDREREVIELRFFKGWAWKRVVVRCRQSRIWLNQLKARGLHKMKNLIELEENERLLTVKYEKLKGEKK